jgi:hypothetical protein
MGEGVTLDREAYIELIDDDIKSVQRYLPHWGFQRGHILLVLRASIDLQYPEIFWGDYNEKETKIIKSWDLL